MKKGHDRVREFLGEEPDNRPRIGKYRLAREIGRGGMGVVYEAEDPELHRRVALKVLREAEADPQVIRRLHREAAIAAQLQHPNIVGIYEVGEVTTEAGMPQHFIAMEYIEGRTLAELLEGRQAPIQEHVRILEEVSRAVAFAHSRGVIHRDLKPDNVLIDGKGRVVLTDFGLAHAESFLSRLTRSHAVMGTPHYMSPEQVEGRTREISERSDVYALGVILYEILAGHPPFRADAPVRVYQKILTEEPEKITRDVNAELEMICRKAMEKDAGRRYRNALDLADDLARYRRGEPIRARPPSLFYRFRKTVIRLRAVIAAAAFVTIVMAATGVYLRAKAGKDRQAREAEAARVEQERRKEQQRVAEVEAYRRLRDEMSPVETQIRDTRRLFYVPGIDIRAELDKLETALDRLERLAEAYPKQPEPWVLLGIGRYFTGDPARAQAALLKAEEFGTMDSWAFYYLCRLHQESSLVLKLSTYQDYPEAAAAAERAARYLQRAKSAEEMDRMIAEGYRALAEDRDPDLFRICAEGTKRFGSVPGSEEFWLLEGWGRQGQFDDQLRAFAKALERRPHFPWVLFLRGTTKFNQGDFKGSAEDYTAAIRIYPRNPDFYLNRGASRIHAGDVDGALEDFSRVIELKRDFPGAWFNRGRVHFQRKEFGKALEDLDQAIRLNPRFAMAHMNKGNVLYDLEDFQGAFDAFEEAIRADPKLSLAYANRGMVYARWGKWAEAAADYGYSLKIAPPNWEHRERIEGQFRACTERAKAQNP